MTNKTFSAPGSMIQPDARILDIETTGRYWRTSRLSAVTIIAPEESGNAFLEQTLTSGSEEDEFEVLKRLQVLLDGTSTLITYNGTAFDLPYLNAKYKAYGLKNPLGGLHSKDLFLTMKPIRVLLGLPSRRLTDMVIPLEPRGETDAEKTLCLLTYNRLLDLLDGNFTLAEAVKEEVDLIRYRFLLNDGPFAGKTSIHDGPFHLIVHGAEAVLGVHITDGLIRVYHTDITNYRYLPEEGYAVHVSVARYVDKSRKEKAVRTNCFHLVPYSDAFLNDQEQINSYLRSVLSYLRSAAHSQEPSSKG